MGIFDKLFGSKIDYPPLPAGNSASAVMNELKAPLEDLAQRVSDHLEVVPAGNEAFVFLGKPPKKFGIAWVPDGKVSGVKELMAEHNLSPAAASQMIERIGVAYEQAQDIERYSAELAGKTVVVIPSDALEHEVHRIVEQATRH